MATPGGLVDKQELIDAQLDTAHLGRVVNSKDASGAPISESTNRTGGVNKTLDALEGEYQADIDTLEARTDTAITDAEADFATQRDQFDATFQAQFQYGKIGNISDYVGQQLQEADKLNSYQYPDDSDEWYGPIQSQAFPITIPADPTAPGSGWALTNALTSDSLGQFTDIVYKASGGKSAVENMLLGVPVISQVGFVTCTGETKWIMKTKSDPVVLSDFEVIGSYYASDFIVDYENPTIEEVTTLQSLNGRVLFKSGSPIYPDITINLQGNTVWESIIYGAYNIKGVTEGYLFDTNGNTGICGIKGIRFNGDFKAENIVRFANCNVVYCEQNHAEKINRTNDETKNYRGGFIYLNVSKLIQGGNSCEFIEQDTPPGFTHGQHQSFSYNNVNLIEWNGLANTSSNADKLWHCDGSSKGNTGHHVGNGLNDNAMYVLGIPQGITATIDCDVYQEGIVFNPSGASEVNVPYCLLKNGSSKVMTLRSGSGLNVGTLKSYGSRTGISDDGHAGSAGVTIEYVYMQDITEERALSIVNSGVTINGTLKTVNVTSSNFDEVARVSGTANFNCNSFIDGGSGAATCMRFNEFTTGGSNIQSLQTNKANKVVYQGGTEFGGKSFIGRLNGFLIQGGAPSTLTINSGAITILQNSHRIDTEGGASTDELSTINGAPTIDTIITLQTLSNVRDVIVKHNTGNIHLPDGADIRLNSTNDTIQLKWNGSYWSKPV